MQPSIKTIIEKNHEKLLVNNASYLNLFRSEGIYDNIELIKNCFIADTEIPNFLLPCFNDYNYQLIMDELLGYHEKDPVEQQLWYFQSHTLQQFLKLRNPYPFYANKLLQQLFQTTSANNLKTGLEFLKSINFDPFSYCKLLEKFNLFHCINNHPNENELNLIGGILNLNKNSKKLFLFSRKITTYLDDFLKYLINIPDNFSTFADHNLSYIIQYHPDQIDLYFEKWIYYEKDSRFDGTKYVNIKLLLNYKKSYLPKINAFFSRQITSTISQIKALFYIHTEYAHNNTEELNALIIKVFTNNDVQTHSKITFLQYDTANLIHYIINYLKSQYSNQLEEILISNLRRGITYDIHFYKELIQNNPNVFSQFLQVSFQLSRKDNQYFAEKLFPLFNLENIELHKAFHWEYLQNEKHTIFKTFHIKELLRSDISIMDEARVLLLNGKVNQRLAAVSILSNSHRKEDLELLVNTAIGEQNDDTRDIILPIIFKQIYPPIPKLPDIKEMIVVAEKRKKLKPNKLRQLFSDSIQNIYWKGGSKLTELEINFLFYRTLRSTEKLSDLELKLACTFIDKEKSVDFSKMVLSKFIELNMDIKYKQLMTLSALTAGDTLIYTFDSIFQKSVSENRVKLAEMVIPKVMSIGTDTALRWVDQISRKMKSKKPLIAELARETLDYAAEELEIDSEELSDKIIPDFGFENLKKVIFENGESYTAYIDFDLSLVFYDDDNKLYKNIPKTLSKELRSELTLMQKEIKKIGKYQESRLYELMLQEKTWTSQYWMEHFLLQPILFVFTQQLIWMECDKDGNVIQTFRCDEDTSLLDFNGKDISIEDENFIKIYHPALVNEDSKNQWREYCFKNKIKTLFDQINRLVFIKSTDQEFEAQINKITKNIEGVNSEKVKSTMVKNGWIKSTGDGGSVDFIKNFKWLHIRANVWFNNIFVFYEPNLTATLEAIHFYDVKNNAQINPTRLPAVMYSEILFDLHLLCNQEIQKI